MAPLPKKSIQHFIHPDHQLKPIETENEYLCDGCKTLGTGKRYRCCNGCDFDLHEYCATSPRTLSSFMHPNHTLTLVMRKPQTARQVDRVCNMCSDRVEGLFYRCKECEFDVHPLCTQLPEKLQHALHKTHPLTLKSSSPGICGVCRGSCSGWRYRCGICNFDIHLECVLVPTVACPKTGQTNQRGIPVFDQGIPYQPPPQFAGGYYGHGFSPYGPGYPYGPGFNNMYYNPYMYSNNIMPPQNGVAGGSNGNGSGGQRVKSMFSLVGQLGYGVFSNMVFGMDFSSLF
ncbi:hypothetical protein ACJIZ3_022063 [Penstemon smallii]|uniref:Phorbol-ester/DAG-type domain-containing protein n=1 Tax=Penstemon smallii TaxID=265156 RepID=A0ABD3SN97_9LAMI